MLCKASNLIGPEEANINCISDFWWISPIQLVVLGVCIGDLEIVVSIDNKIITTEFFCTNTSDIHLILKYLYSPWAKALGEYIDFST